MLGKKGRERSDGAPGARHFERDRRRCFRTPSPSVIAELYIIRYN